MKRSHLLALTLGLLVLLLLPVSAAAAGSTPTFDQAVDQLVAQGYPQAVEAYLCSLGTSPLGFRVGGTSSDNAAAYYVANQMALVGLKNVRLEPVKMDVWEFHSASVTVGDRVFEASSFTGVPGTSPDGVTGELVYVGGGTAAEFDEVGDVTGKIVIVDFLSDSWWSNMPSHEAAIRGAKAVILTSSRADLNYYADPDTLGSNDGEHDLAWPSMVHVSRTNGDWLKQQAAAGAVTATVRLDASIRLAGQGGRGYNVVGELPGSSRSGESIVLCGHRDAFFRSAVDDTSAVVAELAIAKAIEDVRLQAAAHPCLHGDDRRGVRHRRLLVRLVLRLLVLGHQDAHRLAGKGRRLPQHGGAGLRGRADQALHVARVGAVPAADHRRQPQAARGPTRRRSSRRPTAGSTSGPSTPRASPR